MIVEKKVTELVTALDKGEIKSVDIVNGYVDRITNLDDKINAYITFDKDRLLRDAEDSDERRSKGQALSKYDGIPIAVKDNICTRGIRTTCASKILENFIAPYNATSFDKLKKSGFILMGKTNMDEFAMGSSTENSYFNPAKNPFNLERVPGGSSGGSAAAVSALMAPAALGSDTGGSIRQPASFCGVVGIKPTYGRVSRFGLVAFASSLDQIGTLARDVDDAALLLSVISGYDEKDSTSVNEKVDFSHENINSNIEGMVLGVPQEYFNFATDETKNKVEEKINILKDMGATIKKISLKCIEFAVPTYYLIATAEASSNLARYDGVKYGYRSENTSDLDSLYIKTRSEGFGKEVKRRIILGTYSLSSGYYDAYYLKALKSRKLIIEDFKNAFSEVDAIVSPTTTDTAFKINEMTKDPLKMYMSDILTISANLAGIPGISVPVGLDSSGLPMGLQVMGNHFQEKKILNVAKAIESKCESISPKI